ncbi:MAG: hypothetical protein A2297_08665 [Elusimicrobia bacterium RIFOXYB2_FULL_48_7]|nr:MAG: hypothetical protein A2297_08665 [Elusimicrobia bacterium RIFOXYB2_FULL_48_7]
MKKAIAKILSSAVLWMLLFSAASANEIEKYLSEKSNYDSAQVNAINELIKNAANDNLPEECLFLKVKEGIAKGVQYDVMLEAMREKTLVLRIARELLNFRFDTKNIAKAHIETLAEYLDMGMTVGGYNDVTRKAKSKKVGIDKTLQLLEVYVYLQKKGVEKKYTEDVYVSLLDSEMPQKKMSIIADLYVYAYKKKVVFNDAQEIIMNGIKLSWSQQQIRDQFRKIRVKEIKEEMREYNRQEGIH